MSETKQSPEVRRALHALSELSAEVARAAGMEDTRRREVLAELEEVRALLQQSKPAPSAQWSPERLGRLALEFEATHPSAAELVARLSNLLASMGI